MPICKLDQLQFDTSKKFSKHLKESHGLSFEQYILNTEYNGIPPTCKCGCGTVLKFKALIDGPWFKEYTKNHWPHKQHTDEIKKLIGEKCKENAMRKYGVHNNFQAKEVQEKSKKTLLEKYGVDNPSKREEHSNKMKHNTLGKDYAEKTKETNLKLYNSVHYSSSIQGKRNLRKSLFTERYKNINIYKERLKEESIILLSPECLFDILGKDFSLQFQCLICNTSWFEESSLMPLCQKCDNINLKARSGLERELFHWLKLSNINYISNKKYNIAGKIYELDAFLPNYNIGIETNGLFYHSEQYGKDSKYHIDKLNAFNSIGIQVINIFEDEWKLDTLTILNLIKNRLKLYDDITINDSISIIELDANICTSFIETYNIEQFNQSHINIGALKDDELISVGSFNILENNIYELIQFTNKYNIDNLNINNNILDYFINIYSPSVIITLGNRRFIDINNNLYTQLQFKLDSLIDPKMFYTKKLKRFVEKPNDNKIYQNIWDCGYFKYVWISPT